MPGCKATLIDNILINSTQNLLLSGVLNSAVTYHHPIFNIFEVNSKSTQKNEIKYPKYDFRESHTDKFIEDIRLEISNIGPNYEYNELNFNKFSELLHNKIDEHFLVDEGKFKKSKRNRLLNPWITNGIIASVQNKTYFYRKWKKSCSKENKFGDTALYSHYKKFRLELRKVIKCAKKKYYCNKFEKVQGNTKKTWELINELRGKCKANIKASFVINGKIVEDRREIAQEFNIFFSSVAHKLNSKVYQSTLPRHEFVKYLKPEKRSCNSMYMYPCTITEVGEVIARLENGKASDIPISILKKSSSVLLDHLYRFFDYFLTHGIFPNVLKKGLISPAYKKGDSRYLDNYRPVSILPLFGKILEKLIYSRLYSFGVIGVKNKLCKVGNFRDIINIYNKK